MPNIQEYQQRVSTPGGQDERRATAETFGGDGGFKEMAKNVEQIGANIQDRLERDDAFEAEKTASKEATDIEKYMSDAKLNAPLGADGFTEKIAADLDKRKQAIFDSYSGTTSRGKQILDLKLNNIYQNTIQDGIHFEAQSKGLKTKEDLKDQFDANENTVRADPTKLQKILEQQKSLIQSAPYIDNQNKNVLDNNASTKLYDGALEGTTKNLETNAHATVAQVNQAITDLKDDKNIYKANASPEQYKQSLDRLLSHKEKLQKLNEAATEVTFNSEMSQMETKGQDFGKFTKAWIQNSSLSPETKARMVLRRDEAEGVARETQFVKKSDDTQILKRLNELNPSNNPGYSANYARDSKEFAALHKAYNYREDRLKTDPAGYAIEADDGVRNAHELYLQTGSPTDAAHYADLSKLAQEKWKPGMVPQLLSASEVGSVKAKLDAIGTDPKAAQSVTDLLQAEQTKWGQNWPIAARDLRLGHAISDEHYVVASMLDDPNNKPFADDLVRAASFKEEELMKTQSGKDAKETARQAAQAALSDFSDSLMSQGSQGLSTRTAFQDTLEKYILYKGAFTRDSATKIATDAAQQMVLGKYTFIDNYRVPRAVNHNPVNANAVEAGAAHILESANKLDIIPIRSQTGLKYEDDKARYDEAIRRKGKFINTGDESGLTLVDEKGVQVMRNSPTGPMPVTLKWNELENLSKEKQPIYGDVWAGAFKNAKGEKPK